MTTADIVLYLGYMAGAWGFGFAFGHTVFLVRRFFESAL